MHQSYDSFEENQVQRWPEPPRAGAITEQDKMRIMGHVEDLFAMPTRNGADARACSGPITRDDKNLIMWNVDELFLV
jgi:hypothetical protein